MDPDEIITLKFPNYVYGDDPVVQRWRESTLRKLPYFDKLLSEDENGNKRFPDGNKRVFEMEEDPEGFHQMMKWVSSKTHKQYTDYLLDFFGAGLENSTSKKQTIVQKDIIFRSGEWEGKCDLSDLSLIKSLSVSYNKDNPMRIIRTAVMMINDDVLPINLFHVTPPEKSVIVGTINKMMDENELTLTIVFSEALQFDMHVLIAFVAVDS